MSSNAAYEEIVHALGRIQSGADEKDPDHLLELLNRALVIGRQQQQELQEAKKELAGMKARVRTLTGY